MSPYEPGRQTDTVKHVQLTIDGAAVSVPQGTTIFDAARVHGIPIPTLCHQQNENPVGVCRVCVVDVGQRVYAASCIRQAEQGMTVKTNTEAVLGVRRTLVELLMSDHPSPCARQQHSGDCELERLAAQAGIEQAAIPRAARRRGDMTILPLAISVDHEACILCDRCIRGCDEHSQQLGPGAARQGISGRHCLRQQPAHGRVFLRFLRRVHGVLPDGSFDQSGAWSKATWKAVAVDPQVSA